MSSPDFISILRGGAELLDRVAPLWKQLRIHHAEVSPTWRENLLGSTFEYRKEELLEKSANGLLVILAMAENEPVAYCIASISGDRKGEIDSLFVRGDFRRRGVAKRLMAESMAWLESSRAE